MRITVIGGCHEGPTGCGGAFPVDVQVQWITTPPYFDDRIDRAIQRFHPSLIVLELLLEQDADSGFSVLKRLKRPASPLRNIPVVVCSKLVSGDPADKYRGKAMELGAVAALARIPFPSVDVLVKSAGLTYAGTKAYVETKMYA